MSEQALSTMESNPLVLLRQFLAEAKVLGVTFRASGQDVLVDCPAPLPEPMQEVLERRRPCGLMWAYLGGGRHDPPAIALLKQLGVAVKLVETATDTRAAVRQLIQDMRQHGGHLGLDIETSPLPGFGGEWPKVRLNLNGGLSAVQPRKDDDDRAGLDPHRSRIAALQLYAGGNVCFVFRGAAIPMVAASHWLRRQHLVIHNAAFEVGFLRPRQVKPVVLRKALGRFECTMQGAGLLLGTGEFGGGGRSLAKAAKAFFGIDVPKDLQTSDWGARALTPGQLAYAAIDAVLAFRFWPIIDDQLRQKDRVEVYQLQRRAIPAVVDMESRGLVLDRVEHAKQAAAWADELAAARQAYHAETGNPPPSKPAEIRAWIEAVLTPEQLQTWPRTENTNQLSITSDNIKRLADVASARPVLKILANEKLISVFGENLVAEINPVTGRIHADYNLAGTKAGRFSARHPNLQQLPSKRAPTFRRCIVAAPGYVLVGCDWNQVEVRAAAWISGDQTLTEVYIKGGDLHQENAAMFAGVALEDVTKEMRAAAKAVTFGSLFGIGAKKLSGYAFANYGVEMTVQEAQEALDTFFRRFPRLAAWRRDNHNRCQMRGYIEIGCGRVVESSWEKYGLSFPQCCNLPIQGVCADAMLRAITFVHQRFIAAGIRGGLIATVHDELLCEVVAADADRAKGILQQAMIDAFVETFPGAPSNGVAVAAVGYNWAELK